MSGSESMEGSNKLGHSNCPVSGQDQVSPNRKLLPALLKLGFRSRKKSCSSQDLLPDTITASNARSTTHKEKVCSRNVPCAGRVIRNMFISNGRCPSNNHVQLARIIRRTYIGLELVQWLTEHCLLIQSRSMATAVWNILLQLGILLSVERERAFEDSSALYQFSFEECEAQSCVYGNELEWQRGVHQLLQLVPHVQLRAGALRPLPDRPQTRPESRVPRFQMQVMGSLTAAVQNELVAVLARRVPRPSLWEDSGLDQLTENPPRRPSASQPKPAGDAAVRVCVGERGCEALLLQRAPSARPPPSSSIRGGRREERDRRYPAVAGTPEKILEHLLSSLRLDENQGGTQAKESETLLDDFLLTYLVFMSTNDLCQALLGQYCSKRHRTKEDGADVLQRKRKVLHLANQWSSLCRDLQQEHDHAKLFVKTLYRYVLDDLYEYPTLEKDLKELQKLLRLQRRHTVDEFSPHRKNKTLFHQLSLREAWQHQRATPRESREALCRVYVTEDSYLSVRTHGTVTAQELLAVVAERLGCAEEDLELMSLSYPGEKLLLQPHHSIFSDPLLAAGRLHACRRDRRDSMIRAIIQGRRSFRGLSQPSATSPDFNKGIRLTVMENPLSDNGQLQQSAVRLLGMNTWHVAVALTSCDWSLFCSVHEQELVYFTFGRDAGPGHTVALELLLQRCNEVQFWVMSEVLLCPTLCKRVQLFKKFIKIAAHCKAQRNLNSFFAIIMGLNTAAVSRLTQTWEKVPGKFRKLFSELESLTDPSFNHKAYREAFKKMKSPKIPFLPLLLKDITFIHEGNKTFLDNLVNFEKLHMIADTVRILRHCRVDHMGSMLTQKESPEVRVYVNNLHVIDNQQTLFELSHGLEPRA